MFRATLLLLLLLAAPAAAGTVKIGSDLQAPATVTISHPTDWNAWNTRVPGGTARSPVQGELNVVRLKGFAAQGGDVSLNVQVLRPKAHGKVQTVVTSQSLPLPGGSDPEQITRYGRGQLDLANTRTCVKKGDYVSLFSSGGFGAAFASGVPFTFFGTVAGATVSVFKGSGGMSNGDGQTYRGTPRQGQQLLMQAAIGTGPDARFTCQTRRQQQHGGRGRARTAIA